MSSDGWTPSKILAGGITLGVVFGKMALPYVRSFLNTKMLQAAAWKLLLQPARKAFTDAGFVARTALLPTGEEVPYLERPAAATGMPTQRTIVLLHGITTDATGLAFAIEPLTAALGPDVRLLAPDAPGHGASRSQWVQHVDLIGNSMWRGFDRDAHVSDLEAFLVAAAVEGPIDLVGFCMGGATALLYAARWPGRVRRLSLLAPAAVLRLDSYELTLRIHRYQAQEHECVYNYRDEASAERMCAAVGHPPSMTAKVAPMMAALRQRDPPSYWWYIWQAFTGVEVQPSAEAAQAACRASLRASVAALRGTGVRVQVVQGAEDQIVDASVPSIIMEELGGNGACAVHVLPGFGHSGHPSDPAQRFLQRAGALAGRFVGETLTGASLPENTTR